MKKTLFLMVCTLVLCAGVFAAGSSEKGQDWPTGTIQIIVPAAPGGDTDFNARVLADKLSKKSGANFVAVNMSGSGGGVASRFVKDAPPDGKTVLINHPQFIINRLSGISDLTLNDYEFVGIVGRSIGNIVTVSSKYGFKTIGDLINYTKSHPGELKFAANTGATTHATALQLRQLGAQFNIVDAGSASDRITSLLGGHIDVITNAYGTVKDYFATGELVGLAVDSDVQPEGLDIPIGASQGYDFGFPFYYWMAFPKGTDKAIVDKMGSLLRDIITTDKDYADQIYRSYLQKPAFYGGAEGLKLMEDLDSKFISLDFRTQIQ
jgi:tripartite-type tricarboxylate transporter receptor subunit TctC